MHVEVDKLSKIGKQQVTSLRDSDSDRSVETDDSVVMFRWESCEELEDVLPIPLEFKFPMGEGIGCGFDCGIPCGDPLSMCLD
jgi:hypothetical protein